jgi:hypothetical protein
METITKLDIERLTRRINEISEENMKIIDSINQTYDDSLRKFYDEKPHDTKKSLSLEDTLEKIAKIDEVFEKFERRQFEYEEKRYDRLKKLEEESLEISSRIKSLSQE